MDPLRGSAQKGNEPDEPVIDHATGEVMPTTGEWAKPCTDYPNHQDDHRKYTIGWVCLACSPPPAPDGGLCPTCQTGPFLSTEHYARHWHQEHRA